MDPETYETITLQRGFREAKRRIIWSRTCRCRCSTPKANRSQVELPASVNLKVVESADGVRGDTASNVTKPAVLESGKTVNVPLFIKEGETIKIDTRTGAYMGALDRTNVSDETSSSLPILRFILRKRGGTRLSRPGARRPKRGFHFPKIPLKNVASLWRRKSIEQRPQEPRVIRVAFGSPRMSSPIVTSAATVMR